MATYTKAHLLFVGLVLGVVARPQSARSEPFSTAFTYQAQLNEGSGPLNGSADLQFELFAVEAGGTALGSTVTVTDVTVTGGLVAVRVDFGVNVFDGGSRWLEVSIRTPHDPGDTAPYTTLTPRQPISPIPYALQTRGIFVDEAGQVSIGTTPVIATGIKRGPLPAGPSKLSVGTSIPGGIGVLGESTATTGASIGIKGRTASFAGRGIEGTGPGEGVRGEATATIGNVVGIKGITASLAGKGIEGTGPGEGVRGAATASTGDVVGVKGTTDSFDGKGIEGSGPGKGVLGHATGKAGAATGVHGLSDSPDGEGIRGEATAESGAARGVCGVSASPTGEGVVGHASAKTGSATGVRGMSDAPSGAGVIGQAAGQGQGVVGLAQIEGIRGEAAATAGHAVGVCGLTASVDGAGVLGCSAGTCAMAPQAMRSGVFGYAAPGVAGGEQVNGVSGMADSQSGAGMFGYGRKYGVLGKAQGPNSGGAVGVFGSVGEVPDDSPSFGVHGYAQSENPQSAGVLAEGSGTDFPGTPQTARAAALEIRNGAIRVSGGARPAGSVVIPIGGWNSIQSCEGPAGPPGHAHTIGYQQEIPLFNDLILEDSIILATVELEHSEAHSPSYTVHITDKHLGQAVLRITVLGQQGALCPRPDDNNARSVHYLIINPCNAPATQCDSTPRSEAR